MTNLQTSRLVDDRPSIPRICALLGINPQKWESGISKLPFVLGDATAGVENELQVAVIGNKECVDLPLSIRTSSYYKNIRRRTARGDTSHKIITALDTYLRDNPENVWENSWVRFPRTCLSRGADAIFKNDLVQDKSQSHSPRRSDYDRFIFTQNNEQWIRIPVSYLLKLALADLITSQNLPQKLRTVGMTFLDHFLSDNTSPETFSFYAPSLSKEFGGAQAIARETAQRFLLCQCLIAYAQIKFKLKELGQRVVIYAAPHPPIRQKQLNGCISDAFYRQLFMSPCLSGWDKGQEKHAYMGQCHQVLSRSKMNSLAKLKEAGIITRNLVVLPNTSNISLANNGTHISLGSTKLSALMDDPIYGLTPGDEKYVGDLVIKIVEHFLPLFVGTYSAAPYRMDFKDFHPETALGFLPHELDFTHLRMIWRRWKKKASLRFFGQRITPFGPECIDTMFSRLFGLRGDCVPDFRLIDYMASLMSTHNCPALNGKLGNDLLLKEDLTELGTFHRSLSTYLLYKIREHSHLGFSGFEARYYSLFSSLSKDMAQATALQSLITSLAYKYILSGQITHAHIPDTPSIESERRQIFFGSAIGIPTFYVRKKSKNAFLIELIKNTKGLRSSLRYKGHLRVYNTAYRQALVKQLKNDGRELIEMMGLKETIRDLEERIAPNSTTSTAYRLTSAVLKQTGTSSPLKSSAVEFNSASEKYYREDLRIEYIREGFDYLQKDLAAGRVPEEQLQSEGYEGSLKHEGFIREMEKKMCTDSISIKELTRTATILLRVIDAHKIMSNKERGALDANPNPPVFLPTYRAGENRKAL